MRGADLISAADHGRVDRPASPTRPATLWPGLMIIAAGAAQVLLLLGLIAFGIALIEAER